MKPVRCTLVLLILPSLNINAQAPPSYARQVRPVLAKYRFECHNAKALKGGLSLETYKAMVEGAKRGRCSSREGGSKPAGDVAGRQDRKTAMPPKAAKARPTVDEIALIRTWVNSGAKDDSTLIKVVIPDIKPRRSQRR